MRARIYMHHSRLQEAASIGYFIIFQLLVTLAHLIKRNFGLDMHYFSCVYVRLPVVRDRSKSCCRFAAIEGSS